jgi:hypothetical protein
VALAYTPVKPPPRRVRAGTYEVIIGSTPRAPSPPTPSAAPRDRELCRPTPFGLLDGRGLNAGLTDAGLARLRRAWPTHLGSVRRHMMDHLSELDLQAVTAALQRFASDTPCADPQQD